MIQTYELLDDNGEVVNRIVASEEFMTRYSTGTYRVSVSEPEVPEPEVPE